MGSSNSVTGFRRASGLAALLCLFALTPFVNAQVSSYGDKQMGPVNDKPPAILNGVGIAQRLNQQLPLDLQVSSTRSCSGLAFTAGRGT